LKKDDSRQADRDAAARLLEEIAGHDIILERGGDLHGARIERRIFNALRLARADERRRGFETPFVMRKITVASGSPAVVAKLPGARPLLLTLDGDAGPVPRLRLEARRDSKDWRTEYAKYAKLIPRRRR
jgi:hypothetical protein